MPPNNTELLKPRTQNDIISFCTGCDEKSGKLAVDMEIPALSSVRFHTPIFTDYFAGQVLIYYSSMVISP